MESEKIDKPREGTGSGGRMSSNQCYKCNRYGHFAREW